MAAKRNDKATSAGMYLNAVTLKDELWDTLQRVKSGDITTATGDIIAVQAREILRTVRTQLAIFSQSGDSVSVEVSEFAKPRR